MGRGKAYTADQLGAIRDAFAKGVGPKSSVKSRPNMGYSVGGVKIVMAKMKAGSDLERKKGTGEKPTQSTPENAEKVKTILRKNPGASVRGMAKDMGVSRGSVCRILKLAMKKCLRKTVAQRIT